MAQQSLALHGPESSLYVRGHKPARVLAECEAKRRIIEACTYESSERAMVRPGVYEYRAILVVDLADDTASDVLHALALPYADHPDYPIG